MAKRLLLGLGIVAVIGLGVVLLVPACRAVVLGFLGGERFQDGRPLSYWVEALGDDDKADRQRATQALARLGPEAKGAVPRLVELALREGDAAASQALRAIDPEAAVPRFTEALADPDPRVRERAATALFQLGPAAKAAVPALGRAAKDPDVDVRGKAFAALQAIGPAAVPALVEALQANDPEARLDALHALQEFSSGAKDAVPAVLVLLKDPDRRVRHEAADALRRVGPEARAAVPALLAAVEDADLNVRRQALLALAAIGVKPEQDAAALEAAVPHFVAAFQNRELEPGARQTAVRLLGGIGPLAKAAVPALLEAARGGDGALGTAAREAAKKIDPDAAAQAGIK
jgi:HEAT repeat protein